MKAALLTGALLLTSCGSAASPDTGVATSSIASSLQAQIVATELVTGPKQRIPIGITDHNTPVSDATVHVRAFILQSSNTAVLKGESDAPFKGEGLQGGGVYVAHVDLVSVGDWGLEITASRPNGAQLKQNLAFSVIAAPVVPGVGQAAIPSRSPTIREQPDATYTVSYTHLTLPTICSV